MIKDFFSSILGDYQRLIIARALLAACLFGGFMVAVLILAILLMLMYPPYMWCVFGGYIIIWIVSLCVLYAYFRIIRAENRARLAQLESAEYYVKLICSTVTTVVDHFGKGKK